MPAADGKIASYYLAETDEAEVQGARRKQHDEWRWVSFDEAEDLLPPRLALVLDWVRAALDGALKGAEFVSLGRAAWRAS